MHEFLMRRFERLLNDGGMGGAGGDGPGNGDGGDQQSGGAGGQNDGTSWKAPDGIPPELIGGTADETLGKLLSAYGELDKRAAGLREKISKLPAAPQKPDQYAFEPGEDLKDYFGDLSKDPVFASARQAAHKYGMSQDQFAGFISETFGPLAKEGLLIKPYDPKAEVQGYMKATGLDAKAASTALEANMVFARGISEQLQLPDSLKSDAQAQLMALTDTAVGNALLAAFSARFNDIGIRISGDGGQAGEMTAADLKRLDSDPRIDPRNRDHKDPNQRYDEQLRQRYDEAYRKLNPRK
ncbi:hypothetical protein [Rhizobium straminoryzae]|uniref:Uncharacterized protein n=1 Tax=Rhizobium straminoryzae TaxID=1387186 RepID=A0A549TCW7_9HYPH|nr:hypothetical protein [Rhizobium straminoryzae]TRL39832.1 hypothetical protein FNA46_07815 [Rhizobium straminoryzae]